MFTWIFNLYVAITLRLHVPHRVVYATISMGYFGSCFGIDKTLLGGAFAIAYLLLAVGR